MNLLYLIDSLAPGGAETSLAALAPHLIAAGVDLHVAYFHERPGVGPQLAAAGARLTHVGAGGGRLGRIRRTRQLLTSVAPDLLHTTLFEADIAGRFAGALARTPVVSSLVSVAYGPEHHVPHVWKRRGAQALDALSATRVRRFHANSEDVAETMSRRLYIPRHRIDVVWRGRDATALGLRGEQRRHATRQRLGPDLEGRPLVVAVARHSEVKGLDVLLRAVPALRLAVPDVRVVVAGAEGSATAELDQLCRNLRLGAVVRFIGHSNAVADLMAAADVLAFPSRREGLPGTLIEALALECPFVATDLPSVREVTAGFAAALVPPDDPGRLAAALEATLRDPAGAADRARAGRARFLTHFTIERSAEAMLAFYERALHGDAR